MIAELRETDDFPWVKMIFSPPAKNIFADNHFLKMAKPIPSIHSNSAVSDLSQLKRHPSLPPRPPVVIPTSSADRTDGLPRCANDFATAFNDLFPNRRGTKSSDMESSINTTVKGMLLLGPYGSSDFGSHENRRQR